MAHEIGHLKRENQEMKKRVVMVEEAGRKVEIKKERHSYEKLDIYIQFQTLASAVAKIAKEVANDADYAEFVGYVMPNSTNEEGATAAQG